MIVINLIVLYLLVPVCSYLYSFYPISIIVALPGEIFERFDRLESHIDALAIEHNISEYDIWSETGRSEGEQAEFKSTLITYYNRGHTWLMHRGKVQCMGTNQWLPKNVVVAGHIWMSKMHGKGLHKFGLNMNDSTSPRNGMLLLKGIESNFDKKYLCLVYNALEKWFVFHVLNPDIMDSTIPNSNPQLKFSNLHGMKLRHPDDKFPFRRLISFHAACAFKVARDKHWITDAEFDSYQPYHSLSDNASVPDISDV